MSLVPPAAVAAPSLLATAGTVTPARAEAAPAPAGAETAPVTPPQPVIREVQLDEAVRPTREAMEAAAQRIDEFVRSIGRSLDFRLDDSTGRVVLRVSNPQTGELVRQIPSDEALRLSRAVEYMQAMLVNQRA